MQNPSMQQAAAAAPLTIGDILTTCLRRRWLALACGLSITALVLLGLFRQVPLFEAEAILSVDRGRKAVEFQRDPEDGRIEYSMLNTQRDILQSTIVLREALETSGAAKREPFASASEPVEVLRKRLKIGTSRDSWVIQTALRDEEPLAAKALLQAVLDAFLKQQAELKGNRAENALTFLSEQVKSARSRLEAARNAEQQFRADKGIVSTNQEDSLPSQNLRQLAAQLLGIDAELAAANAASSQVAAGSAVPAAERIATLLRVGEVSSHPIVIEQLQLLYALEDRRTMLAQKYLPEHPRMQEVLEQIAAKKGHLTEAVETACAMVEARRASIEMRRADLLARINTVEQEITAYNGNLIQLAALGEERMSREQLAEALMRRLSEEEVASRLDVSQVSIVDPPQVGSNPVNIRPTLFLAGSLLAGLIAAVGAALAAEALDRRVRGAGQAAENSGLPVLTQIPETPGLTALGRGGDASKPPELAEAINHLRASLNLVRRGSGNTVYAITSTGPGEGKSTVAARLAIGLAATGVRTCLVDADMRKPTAHKQIGENVERGLSFVLAGEQGIEPIATSFANLDLLPVGVRPPNPAELLHRGEFKLLIARLRATYGVVIVDTPPLGLVSDALAACEHADGVLLVVRDRHTMKSQLRRVIGMLAPLGERVLGIVVNAERSRGADYGYGYGYGYAYRYGYRYGSENADAAKPADTAKPPSAG
jgi:succinoglycan biosynthesis transport protein ExoP